MTGPELVSAVAKLPDEWIMTPARMWSSNQGQVSVDFSTPQEDMAQAVLLEFDTGGADLIASSGPTQRWDWQDPDFGFPAADALTERAGDAAQLLGCDPGALPILFTEYEQDGMSADAWILMISDRRALYYLDFAQPGSGNWLRQLAFLDATD